MVPRAALGSPRRADRRHFVHRAAHRYVVRQVSGSLQIPGGPICGRHRPDVRADGGPSRLRSAAARAHERGLVGGASSECRRVAFHGLGSRRQNSYSESVGKDGALRANATTESEARSESGSVGLVVEDDAQQRVVDLDETLAVVFDEAHFPELVQEEVDPRARRADHFGQRLL